MRALLQAEDKERERERVWLEKNHSRLNEKRRREGRHKRVQTWCAHQSFTITTMAFMMTCTISVCVHICDMLTYNLQRRLFITIKHLFYINCFVFHSKHGYNLDCWSEPCLTALRSVEVWVHARKSRWNQLLMAVGFSFQLIKAGLVDWSAVMPAFTKSNLLKLL